MNYKTKIYKYEIENINTRGMNGNFALKTSLNYVVLVKLYKPPLFLISPREYAIPTPSPPPSLLFFT